MIVTMIAVRMMQMPTDEIIDMIPMRHRLVPASRTMHMSCRVPRTLVLRRADIRVFRGHLDGVLVDVSGMHVVQMSVVQIINMIAVLHSRVPATGSMLVRVVLMMRKLAVAHGVLRYMSNKSIPE